jgi:hypothetical protein
MRAHSAEAPPNTLKVIEVLLNHSDYQTQAPPEHRISSQLKGEPYNCKKQSEFYCIVSSNYIKYKFMRQNELQGRKFMTLRTHMCVRKLDFYIGHSRFGGFTPDLALIT